MKRRKEVILELTPLLDVILIMMFYILMQTTNSSKEAAEAEKSRADAAAASAEEVVAEYESLEESLEESYAVICSEAEKEADAAVSSMSAELSLAEAKLEGMQVFEEYAVITEITVISGDDGKRDIYVITGDVEHKISYDWDSIRYAENALRDELSEASKKSMEDCPVFMVFTFDVNKIYRRDYDMISNALQQLAAGSEHIYIKYSEGKKNEK